MVKTNINIILLILSSVVDWSRRVTCQNVKTSYCYAKSDIASFSTRYMLYLVEKKSDITVTRKTKVITLRQALLGCVTYC